MAAAFLAAATFLAATALAAATFLAATALLAAADIGATPQSVPLYAGCAVFAQSPPGPHQPHWEQETPFPAQLLFPNDEPHLPFVDCLALH